MGKLSPIETEISFDIFFDIRDPNNFKVIAAPEKLCSPPHWYSIKLLTIRAKVTVDLDLNLSNVSFVGIDREAVLTGRAHTHQSDGIFVLPEKALDAIELSMAGDGLEYQYWLRCQMDTPKEEE